MTRPAPLGLYIHWPYCARICPYCDFNVYRSRSEDGDALTMALLRDLEFWSKTIDARPLTSIHFGGGTPSLMNAEQISQVLRKAQSLFGFEPDIEISLEANPKEADRLPDFSAAGINRISLGVQTLDNDALIQLGRDHDAGMALKAYEGARALFERVSLDLIYARPGQTLELWRKELSAILDMKPDHLSAYQLTIEPDTAFARQQQRGTLSLPEEAAEMYELTRELTAKAGLPAYEISNHARTAAHQSVHNRLYWEGGDWIGIGPGAHSRVGAALSGGRLCGEAARRPDAYQQQAGSEDLHALETLSALDEARERILMGLRLVTGLDRKQLGSLTGLDVDTDAMDQMLEAGQLEEKGARLVIPAEQRLWADRIAMELCP